MSAAVTASVMARRVGCLPDERTEVSRYPDSRPESGLYEQRQVAPQQILQGDVQKVWRSSASFRIGRGIEHGRCRVALTPSGSPLIHGLRLGKGPGAVEDFLARTAEAHRVVPALHDG